MNPFLNGLAVALIVTVSIYFKYLRKGKNEIIEFRNISYNRF